jgi:type II secretory pathway pseudopilin PulG
MSDSNDRRSQGFTVLELCIVLGIFVLLLGIGLAAFRGLQGRAADSAAKATARQALASQQEYYAYNGKFGVAEEVQTVRDGVDIDNLDQSGAQVLGKVYVRVGPNRDVATMVARSKSGSCFWTRQSATGVTTYAKADCDATPGEDDFKSQW